MAGNRAPDRRRPLLPQAQRARRQKRHRAGPARPRVPPSDGNRPPRHQARERNVRESQQGFDGTPDRLRPVEDVRSYEHRGRLWEDAVHDEPGGGGGRRRHRWRVHDRQDGRMGGGGDNVHHAERGVPVHQDECGFEGSGEDEQAEKGKLPLWNHVEGTRNHAQCQGICQGVPPRGPERTLDGQTGPRTPAKDVGAGRGQNLGRVAR
mmetsp:Transcript_12419/g.30349  ORF Transcript_12419/g.30349 Transcript_12419/m.30349 type:complete len:207 (-) Transcript_12419:997-1617(-)